MGYFRFHRSIGNKFFRLNVSKSGFSLTSGVPGAHINTPIISTRKRKSMATLGIPGTGLSYRQQLGETGVSPRQGSDGANILLVVIGLIILASLIFG